MPRKDAPTGGQISAQAQQDLVSEGIENFELPKSIVQKIAKSALPENTKLQKEALLSLVKGSTVFINYLAATAHDVAISKQHKSISASDVLKALEVIELGDMADLLQPELAVYRELAKTDKTRRGTANITTQGPAKGPKGGPAAGSASASGSAAGSPFTTIVLPSKAVRDGLLQAESAQPMDVDEEVQTNHDEGEREHEVEQDAEMQDADQGDEEDGDEEEEEMVDTVAVEEEELRKDARGVEEREKDEQDSNPK